MVVGAVSVGVAVVGAARGGDAAPAPAVRVLVFSKTSGFRHDSIADGLTAIEQLGGVNGFGVDATEDSASFTVEHLAGYAAVVFLSTSGDVLTPEQQTAFEEYIRGGGGYVGIHSAADTEYDWTWYGDLVGAYFLSHPVPQDATLLVEDRAHESTAHLDETWQRFDEWYDFRDDPRDRVHVLLSVDPATLTESVMVDDHPVAWCHDYDGGRAWYTALGHTAESWADPAFLQHVLGGIRTAAGVTTAGCSATGPVTTPPPPTPSTSVAPATSPAPTTTTTPRPPPPPHRPQRRRRPRPRHLRRPHRWPHRPSTRLTPRPLATVPPPPRGSWCRSSPPRPCWAVSRSLSRGVGGDPADPVEGFDGQPRGLGGRVTESDHRRSVCFSAPADVVGGVVVAAIGVDAFRHLRGRGSHLLLATLPLLLGAHQFVEAFVWWGVQGEVPHAVGRVALWIYLLIAFVVLPVFVPIAVLAVEPTARRWRMAPFVALGAGVAVVLFAAMVRAPIDVVEHPYHLEYVIRISHGGFFVALYVVAVCGALLFSGYRHIEIFGFANLVAVAVLAWLTMDGFASLWCAYAAVSAGAIALHMRFGRPHRATPYVLT